MRGGGGLRVVNETNLGRHRAFLNGGGDDDDQSLMTAGNVILMPESAQKLHKVWVECTTTTAAATNGGLAHNNGLITTAAANNNIVVAKTIAPPARMITRSRSTIQQPEVVEAQQQQQQTFVTVDSKSWCGGGATVMVAAQQHHQPEDNSQDVMSFQQQQQPDFDLIQEKLNSVTTTFESVATTSSSSRRGSAASSSSSTTKRSSIKKESDCDEPLTAEEEERRRMRRERNKQAAARCRKRRVDQTNCLQDQVDRLEADKRALQDEIVSLKRQRDELDFVLTGHRSVCPLTPSPPPNKMRRLDNNAMETIVVGETDLNIVSSAAAVPPPPTVVSVVVKSEPQHHGYIVQRQPVAIRTTAEHVTLAAPPAYNSPAMSATTATMLPLDGYDDIGYIAPSTVLPPASAKGTVLGASPATTTRQLTHQEALAPPAINATTATLAAPVQARPSAAAAALSRPRRPLSLALKSSNMARSIEGIAIETPTNVIADLNFDALMDGRTGLTPTNILTPVSFSVAAPTTTSSLNTPTVVTTPAVGDHQRTVNGGSSDLVLTPGTAKFITTYLADLKSPTAALTPVTTAAGTSLLAL